MRLLHSSNLPSDLLKKSAKWTTPSDLPGLPLDSLQGVFHTVADALKSALDVDNLRDLVSWPPRQVARQLLNGELNPQASNGEDPLSERLRPALGEYPTERVYYDKLVMLGMADTQNLSPLSGRLSLETGLQQAGFGELAVGAMFTFPSPGLPRASLWVTCFPLSRPGTRRGDTDRGNRLVAAEKRHRQRGHRGIRASGQRQPSLEGRQRGAERGRQGNAAR